MPLFSICIPNFNYQNYIGLTIQSVIDQDFKDLEIVIADNASTDNSIEVIKEYQRNDARISYRVNNCNVGFAGNLQKASAMAQGSWMTMLSSDDLLHKRCLSIYKAVIDYYQDKSKSIILSSAQNVIDSNGKAFNYIGIDWKLWHGATKIAELSQMANADVWEIDAKSLLKNSLFLMRTPFAFASTTYPRDLYDAVEGYIQGGVINPDKKFAWAILGHATKAIFIDSPLVSYRVHNQNQGAQQHQSGALKHLTDQYISTFQLDSSLLKRTGLEKEDIERSFIEQDIVLRGLNTLADGNLQLAKRMIWFGKATYRNHLYKNKKFWAFTLLIRLGPIGIYIAKYLRRLYLSRWPLNSHI